MVDCRMAGRQAGRPHKQHSVQQLPKLQLGQSSSAGSEQSGGTDGRRVSRQQCPRACRCLTSIPPYLPACLPPACLVQLCTALLLSAAAPVHLPPPVAGILTLLIWKSRVPSPPLAASHCESRAFKIRLSNAFGSSASTPSLPLPPPASADLEGEPRALDMAHSLLALHRDEMQARAASGNRRRGRAVRCRAWRHRRGQPDSLSLLSHLCQLKEGLGARAKPCASNSG